LLAAHRGGISTVLIPSDNEKDLVEIPKNIKDKLNIVPVKWIDEVFALALQHEPRPKSENKPTPPERDAEEKDKTETVRPH
jgi:ATP-dependent Lon protease